MTEQRQLLTLLADGRFHSGQALGHALGVSRARIWQMIKTFPSYGVTVESLPGRGYRLSSPLHLLNDEQITANLTADASKELGGLEIAFSLESTNGYLMQQARQGAASGLVCLAEHQASGKGRRGRVWLSPLGRNLYLSLLWRFRDGPARLGGVSLLVAMAVVDALNGLGINDVAVKWPNDIYSSEGKVGGVLMEVSGENNGPSLVVIGVGLNVDMPLDAGADIDQAWGNLPTEGHNVTRNEIAAAIINHLFDMLRRFQQEGAEGMLSRWKAYDLLNGATIDVHLHDRVVTGIARGIDERGFLAVEHETGICLYSSGEVSIRGREPKDDTAL